MANWKEENREPAGLRERDARMSTTGPRLFPKPPDMVSGIKPKMHGIGKCEQFTELAIRGVINIVQGHLDPLLKVSLQERLPILVETINRQRFHFLLGNVPIPANGFKDRVSTLSHSLTGAASCPV
jgi:hypothetical protein